MKKFLLLSVFILLLIHPTAIYGQNMSVDVKSICTDSEEGRRNFFTKGVITSCYGSICDTIYDECMEYFWSPKTFTYTAAVKENYCQDDKVRFIYGECLNGCKDGACSSASADTNGDGRVSLQEVISFINEWIRGTVTLNDVIGAINQWIMGS